jgi:hypothetical protein
VCASSRTPAGDLATSVRAFLPVALATMSRDCPFSRSGNLPGRGGSFPRFKPAARLSFAAAFFSGSMARLIATASIQVKSLRTARFR